MEARAHMSCNRRTGYYVQGNRTATRANVASSRLQKPVPRLEAALRVTQQCQLSATITGHSAAGIGTAIDITEGGPVVIAAADVRKQRSNHLQAHILS
jgi:hypothetical protein